MALPPGAGGPNAVPAAPTGLIAEPGHESVRLTWDAAADATVSFRVQRDGAEIAAVAAGVTTFQDTGLVNETAYSYTVTAVNTAGRESAPSDAAIAVPHDLLPPPVPQDVTVEEGDSQVTLRWSAVADEALGGYRIYQDGNVIADVAASETDFTVHDLVNEQSYSFAVTAYDQAGNESAQGTEVVATPRDLTPPPSPTGLTVEEGEKRVTLRWSAVVAGDLAGYRTYQDGVLIEEVTADVTELAVTGLANDQTYAFTVSAIDQTGNESAVGAEVVGTPRDVTPPAAPEEVFAEAGQQQAYLTWTPVVDADLRSYRIYRQDVEIAEVDAAVTEYLVTGLQGDVSYVFSVTAVDTAGNESPPTRSETVWPQVTPVFDDFNRPNGVLGVTPVGGVAWASLSGGAPELAVVGNRAGAAVYQSAVSHAVVDTGVADGTVSVKVGYRAYSYMGAGVVFRASDADNYWVARHASGSEVGCTTGSGGLLVVKVVDGVEHKVRTGCGGAVSTGMTLTVSLSGSTIKAFTATSTTDPVLVWTGDDGFNATATGHGMVLTHSVQLDDFNVAGLDNDVSPAIPAGVWVANGVDSVRVHWSAVGDNDTAGYRVYVEGVAAADTDAAATDVVVEGLETGRVHRVEVSAFDRYGNESAMSIPVMVTPGDQARFDDFNRPNGVLGVTPVGGVAWTSLSGGAPELAVVGNRAGAAVDQSAVSHAVVDTGVADGTVSVRVADRDYSFMGAGLVFRASDADNYWVARHASGSEVGCTTGSGGLLVVKVVEGVEHKVRTGCGGAVSTGRTLTVSLSGSTIKVFTATSTTDPVLVWTGDDGFNATAPGHGMVLTHNVQLDDFEVAGLDNDISAAIPADVWVANAVDSVRVHWATVGDNDTAGYRVYVDGVLAEQTAAEANDALVAGLETGRVHRVEVSAFDRYGNESATSIPVMVTPGDQARFDDFNRPNGALGVTPVGGVAWTSLAGGIPELAVALKRTVAVANRTAPSSAVVESGIADGTVSVKVGYRAYSYMGAGVVFRASDANNYWVARHASGSEVGCTTGSGGLLVVKVVDGVEHKVRTGCGGAVSTGMTLTLSLSGSTIKAFTSTSTTGPQLVWTGDDGFNARATSHGMILTHSVQLDDFNVAGLDNDVSPAIPAGVWVANDVDAVRVHWATVGDNDTAGYRVYVDGVLAAETDAAAKDVVVDGLQTGQTYRVEVSAFDRYDNESDLSVPVMVTPGDQARFDDFNRPNGPLGVTPVGGAVWTSLAGGAPELVVAANRAVAAVNRSEASRAVVESGVADGTVSVKVAYRPYDFMEYGLVFRASDADNYWIARHDGGNDLGCYTGSGGLYVAKVVDGVVHQVRTGCGGWLSSGHTLTVSLSGSTIKAFRTTLSGRELIWTGDDGFNATATGHGMTVTDSVQLDDFQIGSLPVSQ